MIPESFYLLSSSSTATLSLLLLLLLLVHVASARPLPDLTEPELEILPRGAKENGTCDEGYEWTVITPLSSQGATSCPAGYKGEETKILGSLAGTFCCPEHVETVPCNAHDREMPKTPLSCPSPGELVDALCMYYYW